MSILLAAQILISMTLLLSGISKVPARTATQDAMISLRLPARGLHPLVARVLPWAEIVLALAVWIPVVPLQVVLSSLTAALMVAYLVIIARALRFEEPVECACFGTLASPTVSTATLGRNIILVVLAAIAVVAAAIGVTSSALLLSPLLVATTAMALLVAIVLTALALGGLSQDGLAMGGADRREGAGWHAGTRRASTADADDTAEELDYLRQAIPYAVIEEADGTRVTLRELTRRRPALLLLVSPGCGPCERVISQIATWQEQLGSIVQIRALLNRPTERMTDPALQLERFAGTAARDPEGNVAAVFETRGVPSAMLLGADGLTAGGPVTGGDAVIEFVAEIREQLAEVLRETPDPDEESHASSAV